MDIRGLESFISVAEHRSFTKAANACFITQTAMSLRIAKLEKELQFKLFWRNHRSVTLTPGGRVFLEEARRLVARYEDAVHRSRGASLD
jgi:DNA-binding transcriptional LysR family regulator